MQPFLSAALVCFLCCLGCQPAAEEAVPAARPNFILIFTDELEFNDLSCYGGDLPTPQLDSLAQAGVRFTRAYAPASMCTPSRYSVLTGNYPGRCQGEAFLRAYPQDQPYSVAWNTHLRPEDQTLPRVLRQAGYHSAAVGKWHVSALPPGTQTPDIPASGSLEDPAVMQQVADLYAIHQQEVVNDGGFDEAHSLIWTNPDAHPLQALRFHNLPWLTKGALSYLDARAQGDQPFFLYLAPTAIHGPNHVKDLEADLRYTPAGFDPEVPKYQQDIGPLREAVAKLPTGPDHRLAGISQVDHLVGQLGRKLREHGLDQNTYIVFIADHNIEPGKATCYEKGTHVPLLIAGPGIARDTVIADQLVENVDLFPTLCEWAGVSSPAQDGQSLAGLLQGSDEGTRQHIYTEAGYARGLSDGRYKLITFRLPQPVQDSLSRLEAPYALLYLDVFKQAHSMIAVQHFPHYFDADQLYDLVEDPYEQHNLADDPAYAEIKASLMAKLEAQLATFDHPYPLHDRSFFAQPGYPEMVARTRAIGTDFISWLKGDHGGIVYPPASE